MSSKIIFEKTYDSFESICDLERDISEMWWDTDIPGEFQGKLKALIWYEPTPEEIKAAEIQQKEDFSTICAAWYEPGGIAHVP